MRILFLHSKLSGYFVECMSALREHGVEAWVMARPAAPNAPFELNLDGIQVCYDERRLEEFAGECRPDGVALGGWWNHKYLEVARRQRRQDLPVVMYSDLPWTGDLKQRLKLTIIRRRIRGAVTHMWVPGRPHYRVATTLGFVPSQVLTGMYACDVDRFKTSDEVVRSKSFIFVGRLEPIKGIGSLLDAYQRYRKTTRSPWSLTLCGAGSLSAVLDGQAGVSHLPFVQPEELPSVLSLAGAFVMPSVIEPWGVAIHEAAAAGLPLVCSDRCAAAAHLVHNNFNGLVFPMGDAAALADCFSRISGLPDRSRDEWGERSSVLAEQFTPHRWAKTLISAISEPNA